MNTWFIEITLLVLSGSLIVTTGIDYENCKVQKEESCNTQNNDNDNDDQCTTVVHVFNCTKPCNPERLKSDTHTSGTVIQKTYYLCPTSTKQIHIKSPTPSPILSDSVLGSSFQVIPSRSSWSLKAVSATTEVKTLSVTQSTINTRAATADLSTWSKSDVTSAATSVAKSFSSVSPSTGKRYSLSIKRRNASSSDFGSKWPRSSLQFSASSSTLGGALRSSVSRTSVLRRTPSIVTTEAVTLRLLSSTSLTPTVTSSIISTRSNDGSDSTSEIAVCTENETGSEEDRGLLKWNMTKQNQTSRQQCPYGPVGVDAVRKCEIIEDVTKWGEVGDKNCGKRPSCNAAETGSTFRKGIFEWPKTPAGMKANVSCPYNQEVIAYRMCNLNTTDKKAQWDVVYNKECSMLQDEQMSMKQLIEMKITKENEVKVAALMNYRTYHSEFNVTVVKDGADLLKKLVDEAKDLYKISLNLLSSVSNVMNANSTVIAEAKQLHNSTDTILTSIGRMMENVNLNGKRIERRASNVVGEARDVRNSSVEQMFKDKKSNSVSIKLPSSLLKRYNPERVYFFHFKSDKLFPRKEKSPTKFINSEIVSASINGGKVGNLSEPVEIDFKITNKTYSRNSSCVYWDFQANGGYGGWSKEGCRLERIVNDSRVVCHCSHLTNFGILVDLFPGTEIGKIERIFLENITFIGCYLSIVGLVLSMITLVSFKKYRTGVSGKILFNLCLALLFSMVIFVAGIEQVESESVCVAVGALLHYSILVAILWMGVEAFHMFLSIVMDRLPGELGNSFVLKSAVIAWILPMFVVVITVLVSTDDYKGQSFCRVSGHSFYIAFLAPTLTILFINLIIFVLVIKTLLSHTVPNDRRSLGLLHFRRVLGIMTVFGVTWIFGVLAVGKVRTVFQFLFCITNSLQGFMIFVIYCMTDRSVRERLVRLLCVLPEPGLNRVIDSSSTQRPTDSQIQMSDIEPSSLYKESQRDPSNRGEQWHGSWPITTSNPTHHPWVLPEEPIDSPYSYQPPPGSRPRVNVPLPDEPGPGVDKLVEATFLQLEHSGGETSLRSADGSVIFINNGCIVDVPRCQPDVLVESSRSVMPQRRNQDRRPVIRRDKCSIGAENAEDLKRWSEMEWLPKLKCYSQTLPYDFEDDDELDEINFNHFQSEPKRSVVTEVRRSGARAQQSVRIMADDDVEHAYYEECREEYGNADDDGPNPVAAAHGSLAVPSTSNSQHHRQKTEMPVNEKTRQNSDSAESDTSSISSLRWSEADWLPSLKSYSQSTSGDLNSGDELSKTNMPHFQEL